MERDFVGKMHGLRFDRCTIVRCNADFKGWKKACVPKAIPRQLLQHQQKRRAKASEEQMEAMVKKAKAEDAERDASVKTYSQAENKYWRGLRRCK